ncbi:MAG TPA: hypothetical protein PKH39_19425 [Woeseiaceae bacterium]|nr:hypothetical protein [Woeseiaceae bacterium]
MTAALKLVGPVHLVGGLLLALTGFVPSAQAILSSFFPSAGSAAWSPFFVSVFGPTIASWGLLFGILVRQFFEQPNESLWRGLVLSLVVWAPLDTALCIYYGFTTGAILNAIVLLLVGALLMAARKHINPA